MSEKPLRVVVLNYNRAALTLQCLESVLLQTYKPLQVVVVDNDSRLSDYEELKRRLPPMVSFVRSEQNLGYAGGNNLGARLNALPPPVYVMILNNDAVMSDPRTCEKLISALEDDETRVACSPLV